ncbi:polyamine-modulated factor 1-binding protein 1 isoform X1 [Cygnus olor]|uniref:polyamine-modulated factor 1-binding protein 1 isoform X1 n=1 Tax=Cygnus olor TaxID=8869 RepID=UPI001ADE96DC|nr:polyamine-modulated factor 1-binding protein 1 isoform X1 [Cygnus olor]
MTCQGQSTAEGEHGAQSLREVPAPLGQPEQPWGGLPGAEAVMAELSSSTQQRQQEMESCQSQGQRQAEVPEPQQREPQACQATEQQELEPAHVLASLQALQLDLDFCRGRNCKRLVQLQQQECVVEQKHQDLVFLMQHYQEVIGKGQKDEAVQTEVTYAGCRDNADTSHGLPKEHVELLKQVVVEAEAKHCRQSRTAEMLRCRAQDTLRAEQSTAKEAQAAAQQPPAWSQQQCAEEQSCPSPGKGTQREAGRRAEQELQALQEQAASSEAELTQSRALAAWLQTQLSQWQWKQQVTLELATQHMHATARAKEKLQKSQEQLHALREQLRVREDQSQGLQHGLAQLQEELGATRAREQRSLQQLSGAKETIRDLQQVVASSRKHKAELLQQVQDVATLQAELAQAQQKKAKQEEKIAAYKEQMQQLHLELRKLQEAQEQSKQKAHCLQQRLQELSSQAQRWQQLHQDSQQALALREEELVVCKVELAFLKEELSKAMEQVQDRNMQHHSSRTGGVQAEPLTPEDKPWPTGTAEVERTCQGTAHCRAQANTGGDCGSVVTLHTSHTLGWSNSSRPHQERELVLVNISQCAKEQMQSSEKRGHKTQQQINHVAELTGNKEHLQDTLGSLQVENKYLRVRTHEQHHKGEQMKVSKIPDTAWPRTVLSRPSLVYRDSWASVACPEHRSRTNCLCSIPGQVWAKHRLSLPSKPV